VIRGGYSRVFDRNQRRWHRNDSGSWCGLWQQSPLRGSQNTSTGVACFAKTGVDSNPSNAFRIGTDGTTVPMPALANIPSGKPLIPGTNSPFETLDFRINSKRKVGYADTFDLTYQRELRGKCC